MAKRVLLVEDEPNLGGILKKYLEMSGYEVQWATDGKKGYSAFMGNPFDICLLDVMMPEMDGFELAQNIRKINPEVPVVFLTARGEKTDVLEGYERGADDYITKPFDSDVLLAKMKALLKRNGSTEVKEYTIGKYTYEPAIRKLSTENFEKTLSPKEGKLLAMLCECKNEMLPRERALLSIWKEDSYFTTRSMDVYITKLRKYLKLDPSIEIVNIHSNGYMLKVG